MEYTTRQASEFYRAGRFDQALAVLEAIARQSPQDWLAHNMRGVVLCQMGRQGEASALFRLILSVDPGFAEGYVNLALAQQVLGNPGGAVGALRAAVALQPAMLVANAELGAILHSQGVMDDAVRHLRRAVALAPHEASRWLNLAVAMISHGLYGEAERALRAGIRLDPGSVDLALRLGQARLFRGAVEQALAVLEPLVERAPDNAEVRQGLERARLYRDVARDAGRVELPGGIVVRGPFSVLSGYGDLAQRYVRGMIEQGSTLRLLGLTGAEPWRPDVPASAPPDQRTAAARLGAPVRPRAALSFLTPLLVEPIPGVPTVNYTMFEGTSVPKSWVRCNAAHDLVVVPTESSRLAWLDAGHPEERLRVCPPGIQPHPGDEAEPPRGILGPGGRPIADFRVRILNISDFIARKNIDGLLRVWLRATRADDDAILILKLGKGGPTLGQEFSRLLERTARHVGRRFEEAAPIAALVGRYDEAGISALYALATHYWSLSHGEGWDLPMTRAGARGLELIAPRNSAYTAYLDEGIAHLIPCTTGPARMPYSEAIYPPFQGIDWWHPDEDVAADLLARVVRDSGSERRDPRPQLLERFSWTRTTRALLDVLDEVGRGPR